jgi:penicillin amidase
MILYILLGILLLIAAFAFIVVPITVQRSFPVTDGEIQLNGVTAPVDIYRDDFGIPHIYASTAYDLFYAQGYVHAQDRFWQMDFWRHQGSGTLSEMFGETSLGFDKFLRTVGWARVAEQELALADPEMLAFLQAYADGVNAYLADHQGSALSLEYAVLGLLTPDYEVEPWEPLHTLTWGKAMAWDLGGNMDEEIYHALLLKDFTPEQVAELVPPYPSDRPVIVPTPNTSASLNSDPEERFAAYNDGMFLALQDVYQKYSALKPLLSAETTGIGSNNWVLSGELTNTGMPILADDMHLAAQMPSIWYEVGLHCTPKGPDCPFEVTGYSFAGAPGVIVGHNDRIAWGFTNVGPDVQDLYIERINPQNPNQYEVNGEWVDMQLLQETIEVAGAEPVELTVRYTRHGPVISEVYLDEDFAAKAGIDLPENYAIALRWTALEPNQVFKAIFNLDRAQNWEDFRTALRDFAAPSQNMVYADVDGNIGYQTPGWIPIRANGDGLLPVPGWTDDYEWSGYIPFEELPFAFNPPQGYIATANNAVVGPDYPYLIAKYWDYGQRAQSIVDMIENTPGLIDVAYIQAMHGDNRNLNAETLVPVLMQIPLDDQNLVTKRAILEDWDYQSHMDSAPAALFEVFWKHLLAETFHDELPEDFWPTGGGRWFEVLRQLVKAPNSPWWDNQNTPQVESRDQVFQRAFAAAVDEMESLQGRNPKYWNWGDLHTMTFYNQTLGRSGIAVIDMLFNRGPFRTSGGSSMVNNTGYNITESLEGVGLPSQRMVVDLSDLTNAFSIHPTGQSGHAFHKHYIDMADLWRNIDYHPMLWDRGQIEAAAEGHLRLVP